MNNFKKIGLTALAGSLIATSAFAGSMSVGGSAGISYGGASNSAKGNSWSSGDSLTFTGSGELDNGLSVTTYQEIDGGTLDDRYMSMEMDGLGKLTFNAKGGSSAMSAVDDVMPTAYGEAWDIIGSKTTAPAAGVSLKEGAIGGFATANSFFYDVPEMVDGLDVNVSYVPSGTSRPDGSISVALAYTGVEGLTLAYDAGEDNTTTTTADATAWKISYAYGPFTATATDLEYDHETATSDRDMSSMQVAYTVSDEISITYGEEEITDGAASSEKAEFSGFGVTYTAGGMTVGAYAQEAENISYSTTETEDQEIWAVNATFAF